MRIQSVKSMLQQTKKIFSKLYFNLVKLPLILFGIVLGFVLDFLFALPFLMLLALNHRGGTGHVEDKQKAC